jgi:hypothetical protein
VQLALGFAEIGSNAYPAHVIPDAPVLCPMPENEGIVHHFS